MRRRFGRGRGGRSSGESKGAPIDTPAKMKNKKVRAFGKADTPVRPFEPSTEHAEKRIRRSLRTYFAENV